MNALKLKLTDNSTLEECFNFCEDMWNKNGEKTVKIIFFIRDKFCGMKDKKIFYNCYLWLYENHRDKFYRNLSHIVGIYNKNSITDKKLIYIMKNDYDNYNRHLNNFITKEYQKPFIESWLSTSRKEFFRKYPIPVYGDWNDLITISKYVYERYRDIDVYNYVYNFFNQNIKLKKIDSKWLHYLEHFKIRNDVQIKNTSSDVILSLEHRYKIIY
ncbi:MAG: DUF2828 family protein [Nitrososphaeraceae archaeon]|nr:DUF2828 family protein [Nitrososphaeraceae archaeon]